MTTTSTPRSSTTATAPSRTPLFALIGLAVSAVLLAIGTFWDLTGNDQNNSSQLGPYLISLGIAAVGCAVVFGLVVRGAERGNPGRRSLILGLVGVATLAVFWTGLPTILACGALATALVERDARGRFGKLGITGLALAVVTMVGAVVAAIAG